MYQLKYLLDGKPISARGLIQEALNSGMKRGEFTTTSMAANFLRTEKNSAVEENPDWRSN